MPNWRVSALIPNVDSAQLAAMELAYNGLRGRIDEGERWMQFTVEPEPEARPQGVPAEPVLLETVLLLVNPEEPDCIPASDHDWARPPMAGWELAGKYPGADIAVCAHCARYWISQSVCHPITLQTGFISVVYHAPNADSLAWVKQQTQGYKAPSSKRRQLAATVIAFASLLLA